MVVLVLVLPTKILPQGCAHTNEELIQLADQRDDNKLRMRIDFRIWVPTKITTKPGGAKSLRWDPKPLKGATTDFLVNRTTVWKCIQTVVRALREEFTIEK